MKLTKLQINSIIHVQKRKCTQKQAHNHTHYDSTFPKANKGTGKQVWKMQSIDVFFHGRFPLLRLAEVHTDYGLS